ncbi:uncharacterized protein LOC127803261 [Diospyros lotus]|uniref:uncharacterized protein LOC127803261 n=1 Tax=Diospyros lotus TaxID=55363 RepID=UPI002250B135|nr:uncharacterized protein LOC127803261 [Diospyros lotus]
MALNESVTMLDASSTAKDVLLMMREHVHVLQLALRRKGAESSIQSYLGDYISFRKKVGKEISRSIRALKQAEKKIGLSAILFQDQHLSAVVKMLREVTSVSIRVLRSLTLFLSSPVLKTKIGGCSMISRVISIGFLPSEKEKKTLNEVASVDAAICSLHQQAKNNDLKFELQTVQRKLESMALCMDGVEVEMECIYKCLIKYRVSLLNVLN